MITVVYPNLSYTRGEDGSKEIQGDPEGTEPPLDQTCTRLDFWNLDYIKHMTTKKCTVETMKLRLETII